VPLLSISSHLDAPAEPKVPGNDLMWFSVSWRTEVGVLVDVAVRSWVSREAAKSRLRVRRGVDREVDEDKLTEECL